MIRHDETLLFYFRSKHLCEWCGKERLFAESFDPHHIEARGMGGGKRLDVALNLMAVHRLCHSEIEAGGAKAKRKCLEIVAKREGLSGPDEVQEAIYRLLRTPKEDEWLRK